MFRFIVVFLFLVAGISCRAEEFYYCLVTDNDTKMALSDIDYLLVSDSEPVFYAVLKNGKISDPIKRASFGKEIYQGSGVSEHKSEEIAIFPNPVRQTLYITCNDGEERNYAIYSINGTLLRSTKSDGCETSVYVGDLPSGRYLLRTDSSSLIFFKE